MREPWGAITSSVRVKEHGEDSAEPEEPGRGSSGVLGAKETQRRVLASHNRLSTSLGEEKGDSSKSCELKDTRPSPEEPRTRTEAGGRKPRSWGVYVIRRRFRGLSDMTPILQQLAGHLD